MQPYTGFISAGHPRHSFRNCIARHIFICTTFCVWLSCCAYVLHHILHNVFWVYIGNVLANYKRDVFFHFTRKHKLFYLLCVSDICSVALDALHVSQNMPVLFMWAYISCNSILLHKPYYCLITILWIYLLIIIFVIIWDLQDIFLNMLLMLSVDMRIHYKLLLVGYASITCWSSSNRLGCPDRRWRHSPSHCQFTVRCSRTWHKAVHANSSFGTSLWNILPLDISDH